MRSSSNDLRRALVSTYEMQAYSQRRVARVFGVSLATVRNYLRRQRQTGSLDALRHAGGRRVTLSAQAQAQVRQWVGEKTDISLQRLGERTRGRCKTQLSRSAMWRWVQALGLRRKTEEAARQ